MKVSLQLNRQLRNLLDAKGILASDLARQADVPKQCISDWLHGVTPRSILHCKAVADALGVTVDELLFGSKAPAVSREIHPKLTAESELAQSALLYQFLKRSMQESADDDRLTYFMSDDNAVRIFSPSWSRILGWPVEVIQRFPFSYFAHPEDQHRAILARHRAFENGQPLTNLEIRLMTAGGQVLHFRWTVVAGPAPKTLYGYGENISCQFPAEADAMQLVPLKSTLTRAVTSVALKSRIAPEKLVEIEYDGDEPMISSCPARLQIALTCLFDLLNTAFVKRGLTHPPLVIVCAGTNTSLITEIPSNKLRLLMPVFKLIGAELTLDERESDLGAGWVWLRVNFAPPSETTKTSEAKKRTATAWQALIRTN